MSIRIASVCHPSSVLLAVLAVASAHNELRESSPLIKAFDEMVRRVRRRVAAGESGILPVDVERIEVRLRRRVPKVLETDVRLCLFRAQEEESEWVFSMEELKGHEKLKDFFKWREVHGCKAVEGDPMERWRELRYRLQRALTVCSSMRSSHNIL